ncbi:unnamed protein product [Rotaria sp. Silwood2]|nr:unnamed protein product [Rotaria sp. Silwood2]CAF2810878.1 unnamed protein product [Rotaria sp. Silwood2]CAF3005805.1 unnamed protein product [Rotaria sp. Silwood2]CAF3175147.1 unnamed protein product [Rotaria sp. Silwood2]CAF3957838.1 unnamed protein product [Rotaria sp. Silwood2]
MMATSILVALNMVIPILMAFGSYRNIVNFYFSSAALSSSLLNCLYIYYLAQTLRSKGLSENNCRAIYYLQTSCTVVLAYTITAMHANFVLCLLSSSDQHNSTRTCLQSCGLCLRRFFRRLCFCLVLCIWSLSFTATIPLLYTIDSNEKTPKPVYCPGTTQISYLEEWFDRNRLIQSVLFNLIPLLTTLFMSLIALLKLFYDCLFYFYLRLKMSKCSPCRKRSSKRCQQQQHLSIPNSISMFSSLGVISNNNIQSGLNLTQMPESPTPTSETTISSSNLILHSCGHWCSSSFLRFLLVLSCCLLACIYPIAMRFYLVYFSVLVPLIFAVLNYSLGQLTQTQKTTTSTIPMTNLTEQQTNVENRNVIIPIFLNSTDTNNDKLIKQNSSIKNERICSNEEYELQSPLMGNLVNENDGIDEHEQYPTSLSSSSQSSTIPATNTHTQQHQSSLTGKQKYFSNNLYENYNRNMSMR